MKLTINHLAPYLPYGLKCEINIFDQAMVTGTMVGLNNQEIEFIGIRETVTESFSYDLCLPVLRNLSDLTKEIEVNGEKFVPIDYLNNKYYINGIDTQYLLMLEHVKDYPYYIIQKLAEWHFDFQGLIPQELAIDINTLNNQ